MSTTTIHQHGPGAFVGDEIEKSLDPPAHAAGVVDTLIREGHRWVAAQLTGTESNRRAVALLKVAAAARSFPFGTWAQGWQRAEDELVEARARGAEFHIANIESPGEDLRWTDGDLAAARGLVKSGAWPHGFAVIFTEGAWGRNATLAERWRAAGAFAIPEAIRSENPQATISAMLDLARALGWPSYATGPCCYLTRGYDAANYSTEIGATSGRYSIFRYGDAANHWSTMRPWPKTPMTYLPWPPVVEEEPPPPPPIEKITSAAALDLIEEILSNVEGGGLDSENANLAVAAVADSWIGRQTALGRTPTPKQRIMVNRTIAKSTNTEWLAADDEVAALLKKYGVDGVDG